MQISFTLQTAFKSALDRFISLVTELSMLMGIMRLILEAHLTGQRCSNPFQTDLSLSGRLDASRSISAIARVYSFLLPVVFQEMA
ncbi:hypothetical protein SSYM_2474 [Serratia symbiotica str. Tucson]|uniref:Uncharacterized protein n=1 Tax=Serratia symbiotica str. Tucson TaxID=914128 RepID=E9CPK7_9GAMM|nr:hypothetical protein SSYM_2474 [Serratia symbiotica str. Tucson]